MKKKVVYILPTILVLAFTGVLIFTAYSLLKDATLGKILTLIGILALFGTATISIIGKVLAKFFGTRVIAKVMYTKCFVNKASEYSEWDIYYAYKDKHDKLRFGVCGFRGRNANHKQLYVKYLGVFQSVKDDVTEEEKELYEHCDVDVKEAEEIYKTKYIKKFNIILILTAIISVCLIIGGAIIG